MRVVFVYTNVNGCHVDCYSFGLASIVSTTRKEGHEAKLLIMQKEEEIPNIIKEIEKFAPVVVGFSSVSSQFEFVKKIAAGLKKNNANIITVCGGVHPTINPECILETDFLDGVFVGESEFAFADFLAKIEKGKSYKDTDNFVYVEKDKIVKNKLKPLISNLDVLQYPDKEVYPYEEFVKITRESTFLFSRGCPYQCSYCSNHAIAKRYGKNSNEARYRSPESSIGEIEDVMKKYKIKKIHIGDDIFGIDKKWRIEFCQKYKSRINRPFSCLGRANIVNEDLVRLVKDAGCYRMMIGVESGNEYVRNRVMNRNMTNEQIEKAFELVHKHKMESVAINIIGVPGETEEMLLDTIKLNRKIKPSVSGVNIFYPYKGTKLGDYCFENNLVDEEIYNSFSNERRGTILTYPDEYKKKLVYCMNNWNNLVYPYSFKKKILDTCQKSAALQEIKIIKRYIKAHLKKS